MKPFSLDGFDALSPAEKVALRHVGLGRTNREIAEEMGLTPDAIRTMLGEVAITLDVRSRSELKEIVRSTRSGER
ncbi:MAG: LuxR C-terminal-related transcriptional regulator [Dehalococcoidia bacterium]